MMNCISLGGFVYLWRSAIRYVGFLLVLIGLVTGSSLSRAADEVVNFDNPEHKQMYQMLLKEYRCLKCQNQNLWDSNASLAGDLRREIRGQILAGNSKSDIDEFLVNRYGEFVLYRPRFSAKTAVLWIAPFVLLLVGLVSLVLMVRGKSSSELRHADENISANSGQDRLARAKDLLNDQ